MVGQEFCFMFERHVYCLVRSRYDFPVSCTRHVKWLVRSFLFRVRDMFTVWSGVCVTSQFHVRDLFTDWSGVCMTSQFHVRDIHCLVRSLYDFPVSCTIFVY